MAVPASRLSPPNISRFIIPLALGVFGILIFSSPPSTYWGDSTEYLLSSHALQVAHPNGYPLTALIGKLFLFFPVGNLAFRGHLVSVVGGTLFVSLLTGWLLRQGLGRWAFLPPLTVLFGRTTWFLFHLQEALTINLVVGLLVFFGLVEYRRKDDLRILAATAFLIGLGAGNHYQILLFLPAAVFVAMAKSAGKGGRATKSAVFLLAGFALGSLVHLYLPLRSEPLLPSVYPPLDSVGQVVAYLRRSYYLVPSRTRGIREAASLIFPLIKVALQDYTIPVVAVAAFGLTAVWRRERPAAVIILLASGFTILSALINGPTGTTYKLDLYAAQVFALFVIPMAWGMRWLEDKAGDYRGWRTMGTVLTIAWIVVLGGRAWSRWNLIDYRLPDRFGRLTLSLGLSKAFCFPVGDNPTNLGIYQGLVGGYDPSVAVIPAQGMTAGFYYRRLAGWYPHLDFPPLEDFEEKSLASPDLGDRMSAAASYLRRLSAAFPSAVLFLPVEMDPSLFDFRSLVVGPGYLFPPAKVPAEVVKKETEIWEGFEDEYLAARPEEFQFREEIDGMMATIRQRQAFALLRAGDTNTALDFYQRANSAFPTVEGPYFLAKAFILTGRFYEAFKVLEGERSDFPAAALKAQALAMLNEKNEAGRLVEKFDSEERRSAEGVLAAAFLARAQGKTAEAVLILEEGLKTYPREPSLLFAYANLAGEIDQPIKEAEALETFLKQFPGWYGSRLRLGVLRLNLNDGGAAERIFRELLSQGMETPQIWNNLGISQVIQGKIREAKEAFLKAVDMDSSYFPAVKNLERLEGERN